MYVKLLAIPLSLSVALTLTAILLLVGALAEVTVTVGGTSSSIVIVTFPPSFSPSVKCIITLSPGFKSGILPSSPTVTHSPSSLPSPFI